MSEVASILLAAGTASRYRAAGGEAISKLVADFGGEPLVRKAAAAALASRARPLIVVTGHAREAVKAALVGLPVTFTHNPDFATGLASSLRAGVAALPEQARGALALLGDMPALAPETIDRLIAVFATRLDALAVIPLYSGRRGNPVLLARAVFPQIVALNGDEGARRLLREADPGRVVEVEMPDAAVALDIDTPADFARLSAAARR